MKQTFKDLPVYDDNGKEITYTEKEKETVKKKLEEANKGNFPSGTRIEIGSDGTAKITIS